MTQSSSTCRRCLYTTDHPLGLILDNQGICSGCRIHEEKDQLDWNLRLKELQELVAPYRSRDSRNYDCIVPVSGAGDSYYIVHVVKQVLQLKPLLVTYNKYYNTPLGIRNLSQLRRFFDSDILFKNVNPISVKKIIRSTLRSFGSFHWPAIAGQSVFPVQVAVNHKIPLIIWGAHQGLEQVGMYSHLDNVEMTRRYRKDHDLMGYEADDLLSHYDCLDEGDVWQYRYPEFSALNSVGVRGIYLGNYIRWDPLAQHKMMVKVANYHSSRQSRTFDVFDNVDDFHYMGLHDLIKFKKHGYSRVVDHATREIRHGRLSRTKALRIVPFYQSQPIHNLSLFTNWLNLSSTGIEFLLSQLSRDTDASSSFSEERLDPNDMFESLGFVANDSIDRNQIHNHVIFGKGFPY